MGEVKRGWRREDLVEAFISLKLESPAGNGTLRSRADME
jgi:hypothetical protein